MNQGRFVFTLTVAFAAGVFLFGALFMDHYENSYAATAGSLALGFAIICFAYVLANLRYLDHPPPATPIQHPTVTTIDPGLKDFLMQIQLRGPRSRALFLNQYLSLILPGQGEAAKALVTICKDLMNPNDWEVVDKIMPLLIYE